MGSVVCTTWIPHIGVTACSGRSKVPNTFWIFNSEIKLTFNLNKIHSYTYLFLPSQDVLLVRCTPDWISQNHVLASCRSVLRSQGILGLNRAPCMAVFLERLPTLLQEQYSYEKVHTLSHQNWKFKILYMHCPFNEPITDKLLILRINLWYFVEKIEFLQFIWFCIYAKYNLKYISANKCPIFLINKIKYKLLARYLKNIVTYKIKNAWKRKRKNTLKKMGNGNKRKCQ